MTISPLSDDYSYGSWHTVFSRKETGLIVISKEFISSVHVHYDQEFDEMFYANVGLELHIAPSISYACLSTQPANLEAAKAVFYHFIEPKIPDMEEIAPWVIGNLAAEMLENELEHSPWWQKYMVHLLYEEFSTSDEFFTIAFGVFSYLKKNQNYKYPLSQTVERLPMYAGGLAFLGTKRIYQPPAKMDSGIRIEITTDLYIAENFFHWLSSILDDEFLHRLKLLLVEQEAFNKMITIEKLGQILACFYYQSTDYQDKKKIDLFLMAMIRIGFLSFIELFSIFEFERRSFEYPNEINDFKYNR